MFKRIGLITNLGINQIGETLTILMDYLQKRGVEVFFADCCNNLDTDKSYRIVEGEEFAQVCDLVIAIGGDGTMLMAAHLLSNTDVPLLGINLGRLGFLSDIPADAIQADLDEILQGNYEEDKRFMLRGQIYRDNRMLLESYAFNDVIIQKWNSARLVELETYVNATFVHKQRSDGIIVSTPTGSTAYALSGGGPILHPSLDALVLVPICPHTLTNRPIVVEGNSLIEIIVGTREIDIARMTCDGDIKHELAPGDRVSIQKKDRYVRLIHPPKHDHFHILREKLNWGKDFC
ncbi:MAG: NAD(+) kinase [Gammaproteobacteria bacterium]